jgi:uncharacterized protein (DUF1684 family)
MTTTIRQPLAKFFAGFLLLAVASITAGTAGAQDSYDKTIQTWRAEREAKLKADDGWLTVSGLFWLREGRNDFGAAPANDIVLPPGSAPDKLGTFELANGKVTLHVAEGAAVTANGKPVRELELHSDVAEAAKKPVLIQAGELSFLLLKRGERFGIRLKDKNSAVRRDFTGLRWYPAKESYRVTAEFIPYEQPREIPILNILGDIEKYKSPGLLKFKLNGQDYTLEPVTSGGDKLFIILRDLTSNKTTYAASRFLYADKPKDGQVILDFNQAINPPCAFTAYATCPLPPKQNRLNVAIEAGELTYHATTKQTTAQAR